MEKPLVVAGSGCCPVEEITRDRAGEYLQNRLELIRPYLRQYNRRLHG